MEAPLLPRWLASTVVLAAACNGGGASQRLSQASAGRTSGGHSGEVHPGSSAGSAPSAGEGGNANEPLAGRGGSTSDGHRGGSGGSTAPGGQAGDGATGDDGGRGDDGAGNSGAGGAGDSGASGIEDEVIGKVLVPGVSVRKRLRSAAGRDLVLEEELAGFTSPTPPRTRVRLLTHELETAALWQAPSDIYLSDFCIHPSGEVSLVLISEAHVVSLVRLAADLTPRGSGELHDPDVAGDPHASESGATDLLANGAAFDAARIGANGEATFTVVVSALNAVIGYRQSFASGAWSAPQRTLIEPPVGLTPFIPIGGSFDTFGAIVAWFRAPLDLDEDANAYVAVWASPKRIGVHSAFFADGLTPLPDDPEAPDTTDSDLLLSKIDPNGTRVWSRVVGSLHEDEPYAIRAHGGSVAVVGRSRRFPGFDNSVWDGLVSVSNAAGDQTSTVTLELTNSSILLGVNARPAGGWLLAGSDGWAQNPSGLSTLSNGTPLLLELPSLEETPVRRALTSGPRHNELRSVLALPSGIAYAGHEDGPLTHSGDSDTSQIHATGVLGFAPN